MRKVKFIKMVASGNDFVVVERSNVPGGANLGLLARRICDRKYGVGADGMLLLEKSKKADINMRIFNSDGSEAEMCGNGARCASLYISFQRRAPKMKLSMSTCAGILASEVEGNEVKIRLTDPKGTTLDIPVKINDRVIKVNFINTGVPHAVVFAEGLQKIDIVPLGRDIRYHKRFIPRGTNVDFVEVLSKSSISVRTYERGVEDETLACGTGSVASALIFALKSGLKQKVMVHTKSAEVLSVYFKNSGDKFSDVWLQGKAGMVFEGEFINT